MIATAGIASRRLRAANVAASVRSDDAEAAAVVAQPAARVELTIYCGTLGGFHTSRDGLRRAKLACAHAIVPEAIVRGKISRRGGVGGFPRSPAALAAASVGSDDADARAVGAEASSGVELRVVHGALVTPGSARG
jgi:hypothetical protein